VTLLIVGNGPERIRLQQLVKDLNLVGSVKFLDFEKNIEKYYLFAQATLLTSEFEGFPNVLIESIACGTPVVAFDCPSGPSEIIDANNGVLVHERSIDAFVDAIELCLATKYDPYLLYQSAQRFSMDRIIGEYDATISSRP
jgi:glycosyltransferase involved in cell wall biosynthesis